MLEYQKSSPAHPLCTQLRQALPNEVKFLAERVVRSTMPRKSRHESPHKEQFWVSGGAANDFWYSRYEAAVPPHTQNLQPEKSLNNLSGEKEKHQQPNQLTLRKLAQQIQQSACHHLGRTAHVFQVITRSSLHAWRATLEHGARPRAVDDARDATARHIQTHIGVKRCAHQRGWVRQTCVRRVFGWRRPKVCCQPAADHGFARVKRRLMSDFELLAAGTGWVE